MYQVSILENFSILKNLKINFHKIFKGTIRKLYFLLILMSLKNKVQEFILWRRWDSNPRPLDCQSSALAS